MSDSLQRRIRERLEAEPEQRALAIVDAHGVGRWWTRRELHERCARVATKLIESKLAPGGVVVIVSIDPTECATSVLAALLCGAVSAKRRGLMSHDFRGGQSLWFLGLWACVLFGGRRQRVLGGDDIAILLI